jgi:(2,2,3-trimethyl-5-oxocyclopent-3-enyl)acetyl-CoA 1,5-monooxygenase
MTERNMSHYDAVVVGAGVTGMYQVFKLRNAGFSVRGFDTASDVGGTWYWNRYPGCRLDTESFAYAYFFLSGITPEWTWSERFAGQPELLAYARYAADKMEIRKNFQFNTGVTKAVYDDQDNLWKLDLDDGDSVTCKYLLTAVGLLSATRMPAIEGIETFKGLSFHTSRWPRDPAGGTNGQHIDFSGKRVGIVGTGATGVQLIPQVAKAADKLYVFQRSPNWCTPLRNGALSTEEMERIRLGRKELLDYLKTTPVGFPYEPYNRDGTDDTPEQRQAFLEKLYTTPGYSIWLANYRDTITNKKTNDFISEFVANKIRERVKDPVTAEKLIPKDHAFGSKRIPMETNYYEVYNQDHVRLVDIKENPIEQITATGIKTTAEEYELDVILYATCFDAVTGGLDRIDIRGKDGVRLTDVWDDGPITYLGLQVAGFPNLFTLVGPHNGASFCNVGVCGNLQVEWMTDMLEYMRENDLSYSEPNEEAQRKWTDQVYADFEQTLLTEGNSWWVKIKHHADGTTTRRALSYIAGGPQYRAICDEVARKGYDGFELH